MVQAPVSEKYNADDSYKFYQLKQHLCESSALFSPETILNWKIIASVDQAPVSEKLFPANNADNSPKLYQLKQYLYKSSALFSAGNHLKTEK